MGAILVLLRHGQSVYNQKNIFTGFLDVDLSPQGEQEAIKAGQALGAFSFAAVFSSALKRATETARLALGVHMPKVYVADKALNERHYGELQGQNKDQARARYGQEQVESWRRSFYDKPTGGESLSDTCLRVLPFYKNNIEPRLVKGENILVVAHGNSLRALIMYLENLSTEEISKVEIPTGVPLVYKFDNNFNLISKSRVKI